MMGTSVTEAMEQARRLARIHNVHFDQEVWGLGYRAGESAGHRRAEIVYEQYPVLLDQLVALVCPLMLLPLEEMAAVNERMQTLAPFVASPLAYSGGARNLTEQRRLIDAAAALQRVVRSFQPVGGDGR